MRAALIDRVDGIPTVVDRDTPPTLPGTDVVVVTTAALNPTDVHNVSSWRGAPTLPLVPGTEGVGFDADGNRIYFERSVTPHGSFAEQALARPETILRVPAGITDEVALAAGIAGSTAWLSLIWKAGFRAGETVIVLGATGAVGQIAVQVARIHGAANVIAVGRDSATLKKLLTLGADHVVALGADYQDQLDALVPGGAEVIFDALFGQPLVDTLPSLQPGGRVINVGMVAGRLIELPGLLMKSRDLLCYQLDVVPAAVKAAAFESLCAALSEGSISIDTEVIPLMDVASAWLRQQNGPNKKLLIGIADR